MHNVAIAPFPNAEVLGLVHELVARRESQCLHLHAFYLSAVHQGNVSVLSPLSSLLDASRTSLAQSYLFHAYISRLVEESILESQGVLSSDFSVSSLPIYHEETEFGIEAKCYAIAAFSLSKDRRPPMCLTEISGLSVYVSPNGLGVDLQQFSLALPPFHKPRFEAFIDLVQKEVDLDPPFIRSHYRRQHGEVAKSLYGKHRPILSL